MTELVSKKKICSWKKKPNMRCKRRAVHILSTVLPTILDGVLNVTLVHATRSHKQLAFCVIPHLYEVS